MPRDFWTPAKVKLLGTDTDRRIAQRLGTTTPTVRFARKQRGIASFLKSKRTWTKRELRWLGRESDSKVARRLGRSFNQVYQQRHALGIPACCRVRNWTKAEIALMGTCEDPVIARRLGISTATVRNQRWRLGIRSFNWQPPANLAKLKREGLRPIPGYPFCFATRKGVIYYTAANGTLRRKHIWRVNPAAADVVRLRIGRGREKKFSVMYAVLLAWKGRPRHGNLHPMPLDGNLHNTHADNLVWRSRSQISLQQADRGLRVGENNGNAKLTQSEVLRIRELAPFHTRVELARRYGISTTTVYLIERRKTWRRV